MFLNNGAGLFGAESQIPIMAGSVRSIALGDVDADGDLDLLTPATAPRGVSIRLNNGLGVFSVPAINAEVSENNGIIAVTPGDLDADGDLDYVVCSPGSITSRLNQPVTLASTAATASAVFSTYPNPARTAVTVAGVAPRAAIAVLDALGRRVAAATADAAGTVQLNLPVGLAPGVYVVRAGAQVQRLLVE
ncbi:T9SS type A sorting domain-containing protein [Hymenobacter cellulosilyticus]|uniref:T9SS type A sorting domain-containing protein n=1 Tax=Hymenobacter cellulosilyticus TaxID=2932248 RepID=A0A8T9Q887_9BACT|nr:T9SS type A sorting domain-containing protein [Hymenobacter cellulosilyticus]